MIPGSANDLDMKNFTWSIEEFDTTKMKLKLRFDNPLFISHGEFHDFIKV